MSVEPLWLQAFTGKTHQKEAGSVSRQIYSRNKLAKLPRGDRHLTSSSRVLGRYQVGGPVNGADLGRPSALFVQCSYMQSGMWGLLPRVDGKFERHERQGKRSVAPAASRTFNIQLPRILFAVRLSYIPQLLPNANTQSQGSRMHGQ